MNYLYSFSEIMNRKEVQSAAKRKVEKFSSTTNQALKLKTDLLLTK